eukprot:gene10388-2520_t
MSKKKQLLQNQIDPWLCILCGASNSQRERLCCNCLTQKITSIPPCRLMTATQRVNLWCEKLQMRVPSERCEALDDESNDYKNPHPFKYFSIQDAKGFTVRRFCSWCFYFRGRSYLDPLPHNEFCNIHRHSRDYVICARWPLEVDRTGTWYELRRIPVSRFVL